MNWYRLSIDETMELLGSSPSGLSAEEAEKRLIESGLNELQSGKRKNALGIFLSQFTDLMILILAAAALISGFLGDWADTIVILIIVCLNATIGFFQEYRAEKAMQSLKKLAISQARVIRGGQIITCSSLFIVPGDLVLLEAGNAVPADLRITDSVNLKINESALTGESIPSQKTTHAIEKENLVPGDQSDMAFKGTFAEYGRGSGIVVATGMQTELGKIASMLQEEPSMTPLQMRMASFGKKLSLLVLFLCLLFMGIGWARGEELMTMLLTSISLAVAAIPEALPAVITIALALAAKKLVRHNSLIRKLPAVETLGSVTYICTDKTGTLTRNKMHADTIWIKGKLYVTKQLNKYDLEEDISPLLQACALNNDVTKHTDGSWQGDSTEVALMELAREFQINPVEWPRVAELAFDSERKMMTTFHRQGDKIMSITKGAPDILLQRCSGIEPLQLHHAVDQLALEGQRVIGFAYRFWHSMPEQLDTEVHEQGLTFLGLVGLIDPPRDDVYDAVAQCQSAGIIPVMITGDHPLTASNIARRIGILQHAKDLVISGPELASLDQESLLARIEDIKVYARVSPEQKIRIVKTLQQKGHFVAMTGDGVNDAPSLKRANIGIAMGITGTDVTRESADMILLDDHFSTIVKAVNEGRRIYDNILKFIKYLMTTNAGELWTLIAGPVLGLPIALLPIHILWINLVSDGLPAISLSYEKAEKDIMKRPPRNPRESVFANGRGLHMIWVGLLMGAIALTVQAWAIGQGLHWQTIVFNVLCLSQMGHVLAIRSDKESLFSQGLFSNKLLIIAVLIAMILQFVVTYVPALQSIFKTQALSWKEFLLVGALSSLVFIAVEIEKWLRRKKSS